MARVIRSLALLAVLAAVLPATALAVVYAIDEDADTLYVIDPTDASATLVGPAGEDYSFSGLAWDTSTSTLYASDITIEENCPVTPGLTRRPEALGESCWGLGIVDPAGGAVTVVGPHVITLNVWGLAYDAADDVLYGTDMNNFSLDTIDRATGEASVVGPFLVQEDFAGLAHDPASDTLYGISEDSLWTFNQATGAATLVGPLGVTIDSGVAGLAFDRETGDLYAGDASGAFYRVDPATGAATLIGNTGIVIGGLEAVGGAEPVVAIPTLGGAAAALLALLLAGGAAVALRRGRA